MVLWKLVDTPRAFILAYYFMSRFSIKNKRFSEKLSLNKLKAHFKKLKARFKKLKARKTSDEPKVLLK